jgi:hypothetical protein
MMNRALAVLALSAMTITGAFAQTIVVKPEQETLIRQYVTTHKVAPAEVTGVDVTVGTTLPDTVELHTLDVPDVKYEYVVIGDQTVLVDPGTRKIVHIVQ